VIIAAAINCREIEARSSRPIRFCGQRRIQQVANRPDPISQTDSHAAAKRDPPVIHS